MTTRQMNSQDLMRKDLLESESQDRPRVVLGICTCNRVSMLTSLHKSLQYADLSKAFCIILVDNHASQNGIERWEVLPELNIPTIKVHQDLPGVANARNRAIQEARYIGADAIVFVDDDEIVAPDWLIRLVEFRDETGAKVIGGPVLPLFANRPTKWDVESGFYEQKQPSFSKSPPVNSTANVLISLDVIDHLNEPFDQSFGLSGGSDQVLFTKLYLAGVPMGWCQRAIVFEEVPQSRLTNSWVYQRALRNGNINMRATLYFASSGKRKLIIIKYACLIPAAILFSLILIMLARLGVGEMRNAKLRYFKAKGRLKALFGSIYLEYAGRHST